MYLKRIEKISSGFKIANIVASREIQARFLQRKSYDYYDDTCKDITFEERRKI